MSSDKRRLKLRVQRLQTMYQCLGKDPNAKGNSVISLTLSARIRSKVFDNGL